MGCCCSKEQLSDDESGEVRRPLLTENRGETSVKTYSKTYQATDSKTYQATDEVKDVDSTPMPLLIKPVNVQSIDKKLQTTTEQYHGQLDNHQNLQDATRELREMYPDKNPDKTIIGSFKHVRQTAGEDCPDAITIMENDPQCLWLSYKPEKLHHSVLPALVTFNKASRLVREICDRIPSLRRAIEGVISSEKEMRRDILVASLGSEGPDCLERCKENVREFQKSVGMVEQIKNETLQISDDLNEAVKVLRISPHKAESPLVDLEPEDTAAGGGNSVAKASVEEVKQKDVETLVTSEVKQAEGPPVGQTLTREQDETTKTQQDPTTAPIEQTVSSDDVVVQDKSPGPETIEEIRDKSETMPSEDLLNESVKTPKQIPEDAEPKETDELIEQAEKFLMDEPGRHSGNAIESEDQPHELKEINLDTPTEPAAVPATSEIVSSPDTHKEEVAVDKHEQSVEIEDKPTEEISSQSGPDTETQSTEGSPVLSSQVEGKDDADDSKVQRPELDEEVVEEQPVTEKTSDSEQHTEETKVTEGSDDKHELKEDDAEKSEGVTEGATAEDNHSGGDESPDETSDPQTGAVGEEQHSNEGEQTKISQPSKRRKAKKNRKK